MQWHNDSPVNNSLQTMRTMNDGDGDEVQNASAAIRDSFRAR
jgi:hypothetical protein